MPAHAIVELMYTLGACIGLSLLFVTIYFIWESAKDYSRPLKDARDCCTNCEMRYNWLHFRYKVLESKYNSCIGWSEEVVDSKKDKEDEE